MKFSFKRKTFILVGIILIPCFVWTGTFFLKPSEVTHHTFPEFDLKDQNGKKTDLSHLSKKIWVASFIFTSCAGLCPTLVNYLKEIQTKYAYEPRFKMVSFSVDPETDTPAVLEEYAAKFELSYDHWIFLTGKKQVITDVLKTLHLPWEQAPQHSFTVFLIDGWGKIRGQYDGLEGNNLKKLERKIQSLLLERF